MPDAYRPSATKDSNGCFGAHPFGRRSGIGSLAGRKLPLGRADANFHFDIFLFQGGDYPVGQPRPLPARLVDSVIPTCLSNDRFDPILLGDRSDLFWHLHELVPGVSAGGKDFVVAVPDLMA